MRDFSVQLTLSSKVTPSAKKTVLIREVSFGEREHHMYSHVVLADKIVSFIQEGLLYRGVLYTACPLRELPQYFNFMKIPKFMAI